MFALFNVVLLLAGCSANWVGAIQSMWPAIQAAVSAIFAFIGAVKSVPQSVKDAVTKVEADVTASLQNAGTVLASLTQNATASVTSQFETVMQAIVTNLNSILAGFSVTDPNTVSKVTELVNLAVAAIEAILALVPVLSSKLAEHASEEELKVADKVATTTIKNTHKVLQSSYHTIVSTPTGEVDVDEALAALPQQLP